MSDAWCDDGEPWVGCPARRRLTARNAELLALLKLIAELNFHIGDQLEQDILAAIAKAEGK